MKASVVMCRWDAGDVPEVKFQGQCKNRVWRSVQLDCARPVGSWVKFQIRAHEGELWTLDRKVK